MLQLYTADCGDWFVSLSEDINTTSCFVRCWAVFHASLFHVLCKQAACKHSSPNGLKIISWNLPHFDISRYRARLITFFQHRNEYRWKCQSSAISFYNRGLGKSFLTCTGIYFSNIMFDKYVSRISLLIMVLAKCQWWRRFHHLINYNTTNTT